VTPDNLSPTQRSYCMSRVSNRDTDLERIVRSNLHKRGFRFRKHVRGLPGSPDIVFPKYKLVVFIDGAFWHGYRYPTWKNNIPPFWKKKIGLNRARDQKNFRKLRRMGWLVIRIWQHEIKQNIDICINRIIQAIKIRKRFYAS
jgi:DNA mismatch endonuclease, patch repair protein